MHRSLMSGAPRDGAVVADTWSACLHLRLLTDVGDAWRALLFGAPPAAV
ncbi:MAG: hypothetical protein GX643_01015 [Acidimicrobiales bacterium]|nr:hypothetical protein [Acidimicrobiales bacterium]